MSIQRISNPLADNRPSVTCRLSASSRSMVVKSRSPEINEGMLEAVPAMIGHRGHGEPWSRARARVGAVFEHQAWYSGQSRGATRLSCVYPGK